MTAHKKGSTHKLNIKKREENSQERDESGLTTSSEIEAELLKTLRSAVEPPLVEIDKNCLTDPYFYNDSGMKCWQ